MGKNHVAQGLGLLKKTGSGPIPGKVTGGSLNTNDPHGAAQKSDPSQAGWPIFSFLKPHSATLPVSIEKSVDWLSYISWISPDKRFALFAPPKNACTSAKKAMGLWENRHPQPTAPGEKEEGWNEMAAYPSRLHTYDESSLQRILFSDEFFRCGIIRNPYARLVSAFKEKVIGWRNLSGYYGNLWIALGYIEGKFAETCDDLNFSSFVKLVEIQGPAAHDMHWAPQTSLLHTDLVPYQVLARVEHLSSEFADVLASFCAPPHVLSSLGNRENAVRQKKNKIPAHIRERPWQSYYDQHLADQVYAIYEKDFQVLKYERSSWLQQRPLVKAS